ncbi:porin, partial [Photobacterium sanctipauli]
MNITPHNKTVVATVLSSLLIAPSVHAVSIYKHDNGDYIDLYGEVGIGGYFGAEYKSDEFYTDKTYIDDSYGTLGIKGLNGDLHYRLEFDLERENWKGGSGDMVTTIDKVYVGYELNNYHYIEAGLTDTAFDDYDKYGDFTFDTTVETGEAGDQDATVKYEGRYPYDIKVGISYSYDGESSSGELQGNIVNGYAGYFGKTFSIVLGLEGRGGSAGESKYGEQRLVGLAMRYSVTQDLTLGFNGFIEKEDIAQNKVAIDITDPEDEKYRFNDYQTLTNEGALISAKYDISQRWQLVGSMNYEA